jgi:hypothetical protein
MTVIAYYCDRDYQSQIRLLGLRRLHREHNKENQTDLLIQIIKEYEITDRLGYFITNNVSNNDIIIYRIF